MSRGSGATVPAAVSRFSALVLVLVELGLVAIAIRFGLSLQWVTGLDQVFVFGLVPVSVAVYLEKARRGPAERRASLALVAVSTCVALLMCEVLLQSLAAYGGPPEGPTMGDVIDSARVHGEALYPSIPGSILVASGLTLDVPGGPVRPVTPAPGEVDVLLCVEGGSLVRYKGDRFGFNNPDAVWDDPPSAVVIGDSYVHGVCVDHKDQLPNLLPSARGGVNLGARGAGPLQELAILREYGPIVGPQDVFWIYYEGNDLFDLDRELSDAELPRYLEPEYSQELALQGETISLALAKWLDSMVVERNSVAGQPMAEPPIIDVLVRSIRLELVRDLSGFGVLFPSELDHLQEFSAILALAEREVSRLGGNLTFVYLPARRRYASWIGDGVAGREEVLAVVRDLGVETVDLHQTLKLLPRATDLWTGPGGHLNARGYQVVAQAIQLAGLGGSAPGREP